ncbi:hypothetical protein LROSRS0_2333 [Furfurilactobacillus rossiae]|nr:hypothetical protein LROSRS0_2333 [Furfurilactobacillus rossiae]
MYILLSTIVVTVGVCLTAIILKGMDIGTRTTSPKKYDEH